MRKIISLILCLISLPAAAQIIPPRYAGSDDPDVFRKQFEKNSNDMTAGIEFKTIRVSVIQ